MKNKMNTALLLITLLSVSVAVYSLFSRQKVAWHYNDRIEYLEKVNGGLNIQIGQLKLEKEQYEREANIFFERAEVATRNAEIFKRKYNEEKNRVKNLNADDALSFFGEWTKSTNNN